VIGYVYIFLGCSVRDNKVDRSVLPGGQIRPPRTRRNGNVIHNLRPVVIAGLAPALEAIFARRGPHRLLDLAQGFKTGSDRTEVDPGIFAVPLVGGGVVAQDPSGIFEFKEETSGGAFADGKGAGDAGIGGGDDDIGIGPSAGFENEFAESGQQADGAEGECGGEDAGAVEDESGYASGGDFRSGIKCILPCLRDGVRVLCTRWSQVGKMHRCIRTVSRLAGGKSLTEPLQKHRISALVTAHYSFELCFPKTPSARH
jgi:hypothetical protein